ncbi:MAG: putative DNA base hypermodification protein [Melioribacteraceae bacterium]|nr:putative DNA base hypermodification protein [Melioribacteraceae bacterium]
MPNKTLGNLFVIEGPDGVGKTTICKIVCDELKKKNVKVKQLSFPGNIEGTLGKFVYELHHNKHKELIHKTTPTSLQALHISAHIDYIESIIIPELKSGENIILDRFWWSTLIYGKCSGIDDEILNNMIKLEESVWGSFKPSLIFYIKADNPFNQQDVIKWDILKKTYENFISSKENKSPTAQVYNRNLLLSTKEIQLMCESKIYEKNRISIFSSISPAKPTSVFNTYWKFAVERQEIFFKRFNKKDYPWSEDEILQKYKFTNAYRASDRVSQYLIKEIICKGDQNPEEVFFRIMFFKLFNKIETWESVQSTVGSISPHNYSYKTYNKILINLSGNNKPIYSSAYIMPSGNGFLNTKRKHQMHLKLLELMMKDSVPQKIIELKRFSDLFELFLSYPTIGEFLAYQYSIDINYSDMTNFSEMDFVVPGPGAKGGIQKCFSDLGGLNQSEIIKVVTDIQEKEFERLGLTFKSLWGRRLQLIDCQNLFCEVDKYARIAHPEFTKENGRKKIKQKFKVSPNDISFWYPPKWGLNDYIAKDITNE